MKQTIMEVLKKINEYGLDNTEWNFVDTEVMSKEYYGTTRDIELKPGISLYVKTDEEVKEFPMPDELMSLEDSSEKLLVYYV